MKILLIQKFSIIEPLGLMVIGKAMKDKGHQVDYYLYKGNYICFPHIKDIHQYDLYGFSTYTGNHREVYWACDWIREEGIKTAIGGPHASFFYDECKQHADYVFRGESVLSFPNMDDKKIYPLVDPDLLIPEREEFYKFSPEHKNNRIKNIMTSFGCPFACTYCYNSRYREIYPNFKVRLRSVDSVIEEAKTLDAELIFFQDDFFGFNKEWLREFKEKWNGSPYHAQMRIEMLDLEKIELLIESGCVSATIAIEAYSEEYREKVLNRKMKNDVIINNCKNLLSGGVKLRTEQMLGLPNTTFEDELNLLKMNCEINPTIAWTSIFQPYRGTELGEYCVNNHLYDGNNEDVDESFFTNTVLNYSEDRKKEILELQKIFALCAHIPEGWKYAEQIIKHNNNNLKEHLYSVLYRT
jgi:anaerobic magnesium-protoporphyrin IX monomethyl ester cyclase